MYENDEHDILVHVADTRNWILRRRIRRHRISNKGQRILGKLLVDPGELVQDLRKVSANLKAPTATIVDGDWKRNAQTRAQEASRKSAHRSH